LYLFLKKYKIKTGGDHMKQNTRAGNLTQIWEEMERRLMVMRYSKSLVLSYRQVYGWVTDFLSGYGEKDYSKEFGQRFIAEYRLQTNHTPSMFKKARTVIRRIDEILEDKAFSPCFRERAIECPHQYSELQSRYLDKLAQQGYRDSTITSRKLYTGRFLAWISEDVLSLENLVASDLYNVFVKHEWPTVGYSSVRGFLTFLYESGITKVDMSVCVPKPPRPRSLPSVYSGDEVSRLLSSVDRTTSLGKRDYAFLMIAANMGLRSSDIVNLVFGDIDYTKKTIEVVQAKTNRPLTLVLNDDVNEAITDYIRHGRPQSQSEIIFLSTQAPYTQLTAGGGYAIVHKYMELAGIKGMGRKRGPQALRQSYATALVAKGVPYSIVKEALGHEDPESAKHYVRIDIKRLRPCAINVPKPIGAFAVVLGDLEGVL
jgi:site-specific recombinase XerD